jgi:hypothetical protein
VANLDEHAAASIEAETGTGPAAGNPTTHMGTNTSEADSASAKAAPATPSPAADQTEYTPKSHALATTPLSTGDRRSLLLILLILLRLLQPWSCDRRHIPLLLNLELLTTNHLLLHRRQSGGRVRSRTWNPHLDHSHKELTTVSVQPEWEHLTAQRGSGLAAPH